MYFDETSYFERLRSRESYPCSPSKVKVPFQSERLIKRAALFCSFWSLSDCPHIYDAQYGAKADKALSVG